jgi:hypothetical protein
LQALIGLRSLVREDGGGVYWDIETHSPFYGWGLAGRVETTALALQAFAMTNRSGFGKTQPELEQDARRVSKALLFLINNKDQHGVWYSTQATVRVLDALLSLSPDSAAQTDQEIDLIVNGSRVKRIRLGPGTDRGREATFLAPIQADLTPALVRGNNRVELIRSGGGIGPMVNVVWSYYRPWRRDGDPGEAANSTAPELRVGFDKTSTSAGDPITCGVEVKRNPLRGFGMLLAEIGLPPGAEVDRASLDETKIGSVDRYEILPDRVVFYMRPKSDRTRFEFKFRSRFEMKAQSAASVVYDYYNPEARSVVRPVRFVVKP